MDSAVVEGDYLQFGAAGDIGQIVQGARSFDLKGLSPLEVKYTATRLPDVVEDIPFGWPAGRMVDDHQVLKAIGIDISNQRHDHATVEREPRLIECLLRACYGRRRNLNEYQRKDQPQRCAH